LGTVENEGKRVRQPTWARCNNERRERTKAGRLNGPERAGVFQCDVDRSNAGHSEVGQSDGFDIGQTGGQVGFW